MKNNSVDRNWTEEKKNTVGNWRCCWFFFVCPEKPCFAWHVTAAKAAFFFLEDFI